MKSFAFLTHPVNKKTGILPRFLARKIPPFKIIRMKNIRSSQGKEIQGFIFVLPLLSEELEKLGEHFVIEKILGCGRQAERLGAGILGLDGYIAKAADKNSQTVARNLKIPFTSGNAFSAWSIIEAIYRVATIRGLELRKSTVAVIGAAKGIGNLCARKLSDYVDNLIISDKEDAPEAIKKADIVVNTIKSSTAESFIEALKPNTIVCDISQDADLADDLRKRPDITFVEAGLVKMPYPPKGGLNIGLPKDIIPTALAETMLLTFSEKFVSYSMGENINPDHLEEIADIAVRHGFEVWVEKAPLS